MLFLSKDENKIAAIFLLVLLDSINELCVTCYKNQNIHEWQNPHGLYDYLTNNENNSFVPVQDIPLHYPPADPPARETPPSPRRPPQFFLHFFSFFLLFFKIFNQLFHHLFNPPWSMCGRYASSGMHSCFKIRS